MNLTPKEESLLQELRAQERLCVEKYGRYAAEARDQALKDLFAGIGQTESRHLQTLDQISAGSPPRQMQQGQQSQQGQQMQQGQQGQQSQRSRQSAPRPDRSSPDWQQDSFLCSDALTTEKHASGFYDTSIFEFRDPAVRAALNHIQSEEQGHGQSIYSYMQQNGMYN